MKYWVSGATGFVGGRVVEMLRDAGHEVVAPVRDPSRAQGLRGRGVEVRQGDITDKDSLYASMRSVDGVFHIAGWYQLGARDPSPAERINVGGTRNALEVMKELEIPKGVYTSSLASFGNTRGRVVDEGFVPEGPWPSEYDRSKWAAHFQVADPMIEAGLPLVIVLPGVVYGPGDHSLLGLSMGEYLKGRLPVLPRGAAICPAHVDDVARGHLLAMEKGHPGESYIIGGPPVTVAEIFRLAESISGLRAPRMHLPAWMLRLSAVAVRPLELIGVRLPPLFTAEALRTQAGVTYMGSNAKAREELGHSVRPLEEGLREVIAHLEAGG